MRGRALTLFASALALALGVTIFLVRAHQLAGPVGAAAFPLDDAWIHMHFARNLAEGRGFAYNPGAPVSGSTAPLWTLALGGLFAIFGSHPALAKGLGLAATLATAGLAGRLVRIWTGCREAALLAAVLTASAAPMVWGALSGMEVSLAALLVTAAVLLHAQGYSWAAATALGLGGLARPEALVLLPLFWLAGPLTWRRGVRWLVPVAILLAPWIAFNLATTGGVLSATAAAKIEGGVVGFLSGAREPLVTAFLTRPWQFETEWIRWLWQADVLLPLLLLPGLYNLGRRLGRAALAPASVLLAHPLAMALLAPYRGPDFQEGRYCIHLLPLAFVVAVVPLGPPAARPLLDEGDGRIGRAPPRRWGVTAAAARRAVGLGLLAGALAALPGAATRYGWAVQNIEAMQVHLGRWVARHTPPRARLALNDVGAIAYFSRREVVDVMGLVTPAIIPFRRAGEMGVLRYLERACPDYLIVFPAWFPTISAMADRFEPVYRVRLAHNTVAGAEEMVVYEALWSRWRADRRPCPGAVARPDPARWTPREKFPGSYNRDVGTLTPFGRVIVAGIALGSLLFGPFAPASAQIYRWTDGRGEVRYSQGINSVPPELRGGAAMMSAPEQPGPSASATPSAESGADGVARIPFTPGRPIVVNARINGGGTTPLILDTGAQGTVISPNALAALGVSYRNAVRGSIRGVTGNADVLAVRVESIEVDGARFGPLMVVSHDAGLGAGSEGLLGRDFLDNFIVTIDSVGHVVTLTPKK